jgi:cGMP-dependent protein kinase
MEYVNGKELFDIMREINLFNKEQTQFYGASMLEVINYLHKNKIIYRDLKPENIMMKENGYIKFIDFGTVKEIRDRTKTFIGTYSYMAPEVFIGQGYSFEVDMWSLAIIMYEFLCGKLPFGEDFDEEEDTMKFYDVLKKEKLAFPSFIQDEDFKDLIQNMLIMDPSKRLNQYSKIRAHPFFKGFDWDKLDSCELRAPYNFKCTKKINMNNTKSYLDYLTSLSRKPYYKKLASLRQLKFQKWYDNF